MHTWPTRVGSVLHMLDPAIGPRLVLERLWHEVKSWNTIGGIWLQCRAGHLTPSGTFMVGEAMCDAEEIAALATPATAPIQTDGLPVVARQLRDGNVPIAILMVSHKTSEEAAAFIVDVLSRYCMDRLRVQLEVSELSEENQVLRGAMSYDVKQHDILTNSGVMNSLIQSAVRAAASTATVLVQGETGTGKELLAKLIHSHSHRANKPMVSINAGALSPGLLESELFGHARGAFTGADHERKGLFEVANGGTLFLDEIGTMGMDMQAKILRVLQDRRFMHLGGTNEIQVDVRIVAATNVNLQEAVREGRFREDLFYRLNVICLELPPLRSRREDIPLLAAHFLRFYADENGTEHRSLSPEALRVLMDYEWPGNVRELENAMERGVVLSTTRTITPDLLPSQLTGSTYSASLLDHKPDASLFDLMEEIERRIISDRLERCHWNQTEAAEFFKIPLSTLNQKIKRLNIEVKKRGRD